MKLTKEILTALIIEELNLSLNEMEEDASEPMVGEFIKFQDVDGMMQLTTDPEANVTFKDKSIGTNFFFKNEQTGEMDYAFTIEGDYSNSKTYAEIKDDVKKALEQM